MGRNFGTGLKIGDLVQCVNEVYVANVENWVGLVCQVSPDMAYVFWLGVDFTHFPGHPNSIRYFQNDLRKI